MSRASVLAVVALGAAAAALPALAQDASADRYGPPAASPGAYQAGAYRAGPSGPPSLSAAGPPEMMRGRTLSWPGKQDQTAAPAYAPPQAVRAYAPQTYAAGGYRAPAYATANATPRAYPSPTYSARAYPPPPSYGGAAYPQRLYSGTTAARQPYGRPAPVRQADPDRAAAYPSPPRAYAPPAYTAGATGPDGWRPVFAEAPARAPMQGGPAEPPPVLAGAPSRPADLPASIYTPASTPEMTPAQRAAAAPPPLRTTSAAQRYGYDPSQGHAVRFYSVHRPFGLQPDAAPIPPQFFTATADLSQPAGPLPTDRTTTTTTASGARVSHVAPDTSVN